MYVVKRNGQREGVDFNKVTNRIKKLFHQTLTPSSCPRKSAAPSTMGSPPNNSTISRPKPPSVLDDAPSGLRSVGRQHRREQLHKQTSDDFEKKFNELNADGRVNENAYYTFQKHKEDIKKAINYDRDYFFDFFGQDPHEGISNEGERQIRGAPTGHVHARGARHSRGHRVGVGDLRTSVHEELHPRHTDAV